MPLATRVSAILFTLSATALFHAPLMAEVHGFAALPVDASQETGTVVSTGTGTINAVYDDQTNVLIYSIPYTLDGTNTMTMAHFHGPAAAGATAPPVVTIASTGGTTGVIQGSATLSPSEENDLLAGLWYVNVHSNVFGSGEIRGQLIPGTFTHSYSSLIMDGTQGPSVITPAGTGVISAAYNSTSNILVYALTYTGMTSNTTVAHFHGPATTTGTAGPVVTIPDVPSATAGATGGSATLTEPQEADLLGELWYINVHTGNNPGGEIRTQMIADGSAVDEWIIF